MLCHRHAATGAAAFACAPSCSANPLATIRPPSLHSLPSLFVASSLSLSLSLCLSPSPPSLPGPPAPPFPHTMAPLGPRAHSDTHTTRANTARLQHTHNANGRHKSDANLQAIFRLHPASVRQLCIHVADCTKLICILILCKSVVV